LKPAMKRVYADLANRVTIPGFRKGHVPPAMIDARVGRATVIQEAVNAVLPQVYASAVEEHKLTPLGQPEIEMTNLDEAGSVEFAATVYVVPEFTMPDPHKIAVTVTPLPDTDEVVAQQIGVLRDRFATLAPADGPAAVGDQVTINLTGAQDGAILPDASAAGIPYVIGSGGMLDGLDEAVTGCVAGDVRTFTSTLVGGAHAGEPAEITVTVTGVESRTLPDVDDDFAQLVSQFDTVDEMKQDLAKAAANAARMDQLVEARDKVLDAAIAAAGIEVPEEVVAAEVEARTAQLRDQLKGAGLSLTDYLARTGDSARTLDDLEARTRVSVERQIRGEILLDRVADQEKVPVDQEDLTNLIFQKARENGTTPEQELEHMQEHNHLAAWMGQIRQSKALDTLVAKSKVTDTTGQRLDLARLVIRPESLAQPE